MARGAREVVRDVARGVCDVAVTRGAHDVARAARDATRGVARRARDTRPGLVTG